MKGAAKPEDQHLVVALPAPEAADLSIRAAQAGVSTAELLGYHTLRSAYGALHPRVIAFEKRPKLGHAGTHRSTDSSDELGGRGE